MSVACCAVPLHAQLVICLAHASLSCAAADPPCPRPDHLWQWMSRPRGWMPGRRALSWCGVLSASAAAAAALLLMSPLAWQCIAAVSAAAPESVVSILLSPVAGCCARHRGHGPHCGVHHPPGDQAAASQEKQHAMPPACGAMCVGSNVNAHPAMSAMPLYPLPQPSIDIFEVSKEAAGSLSTPVLRMHGHSLVPLNSGGDCHLPAVLVHLPPVLPTIARHLTSCCCSSRGAPPSTLARWATTASA